MRRRVSLLVVVLALAVPMLPAPTATAQTAGEVYPIVFPIDGGGYEITDSFGDARDGHSHAGVDIMADAKGQPVVAAADGTVKWIGSDCCYLAIEHPDGWETWYIHLNNDTQNPDGSYSDDGLGNGIAEGIAVGTTVEAGQLIGYTGDSGNAEGSQPHLHFEIRQPDDVPIDPYPSLLAAEAGTFLASLPCPEGEVCDTVAFQEQGGRFDLWEALVFNPELTSFYFGNPGDVPFSGDWDCDGVESPGLYRRSDGYAYLRNSNSEGVADITFFFGEPGDYPLAGEFE
ncbi:MAG: M23 family metallopeptidase, partial [Acidimicrobiia bacterium]